jgi:hypothetical protein
MAQHDVPDVERKLEREGQGRPWIEPDPVIEAYKKDVDRTLIRENLRRSVEERLRDLMRMQRFAEDWREAAKKTFR